jgi:MarR family transcriptional regulator, lower aerobic nicotinate degradation pathway regulator
MPSRLQNPKARSHGARSPGRDLKEMPGHLIRRAHQLSMAIFSEECGAALDLTSVQYAVLFSLRAAGELDSTRLAEQIAFDRSTISDVVDRLVRRGWITRVASHTDRRVKVLQLTDAGVALLRQVDPAVARVQERLLEPFSSSEQALFLRMLRQLDGIE